MAERFIKARWYTPTNGRKIDLVVAHSMEAPEKPDTAEGVANYFAGLPATRKASAHWCFDADSQVRCVRDKDVAYAAPGANHNGLQYEHAGYARQSRRQWTDRYSKRMLKRSARQAAEDCRRYDIPITFRDHRELVDGKRGITTHNAVTNAFKQSTHTDPGPDFPMTWWIDRILFYAKGVRLTDLLHAFTHDRPLTLPSHPRQVRIVQKALGMRVGSGRWGKATRRRYAAKFPGTNGKPNIKTLEALGREAGFPVGG